MYTGAEKPISIVVDPIHGVMFWNEIGDVKRIRRATLSGSNRAVVVNKTESTINDITLDYEVCSGEEGRVVFILLGMRKFQLW